MSLMYKKEVNAVLPPTDESVGFRAAVCMIHPFLLRQPKKHHRLYSVSEVANYVSAICNHDGIELHPYFDNEDTRLIRFAIQEYFRS